MSGNHEKEDEILRRIEAKDADFIYQMHDVFPRETFGAYFQEHCPLEYDFFYYGFLEKYKHDNLITKEFALRWAKRFPMFIRMLPDMFVNDKDVLKCVASNGIVIDDIFDDDELMGLFLQYYRDHEKDGLWAVYEKSDNLLVYKSKRTDGPFYYESYLFKHKCFTPFENSIIHNFLRQFYPDKYNDLNK